MKLSRKELASLGHSVTSSSMEGKMLRDFAGKVGYENAEILIPFILAHWQLFTLRPRLTPERTTPVPPSDPVPTEVRNSSSPVLRG